MLGCNWVAFEYAHGGGLVNKKSSQNNSTKVELEEALYVALEGAPKVSL